MPGFHMPLEKSDLIWRGRQTWAPAVFVVDSKSKRVFDRRVFERLRYMPIVRACSPKFIPNGRVPITFNTYSMPEKNTAVT
jgi:hypothetical protein